MPDSDSDDSSVRPVPKKGPAARARRPRALQDGMSAEEILQLSGVRCRNGDSCCMVDEAGDTKASPEHHLQGSTSQAPLETPFHDGSGTALPQKALHVSTRSMSSRDSQESDDSLFLRVPKGKASLFQPTSTSLHTKEREEVTGADDLPSPLPEEKLASTGSPLDRIRIVAGQKAGQRRRRRAEVEAESDLLTVASWMSAGSAGIESSNATALELAIHMASPASTTRGKRPQVAKDSKEEVEEEQMELHVLGNLIRIDEEDNESQEGATENPEDEGISIQCGDCPQEEGEDEDMVITVAKDLTLSFEEGTSTEGMIRDAIEHVEPKKEQTKGMQLSVAEEAATHRKAAHACFSGIVCGCSLSNQRGGDHCLMQVSPEDLIEVHNETYGAPRAPRVEQVKSTLKRGVPLKKLLETQEDSKQKTAVFTGSLASVTTTLHKEYWKLKCPATGKQKGALADAEGRKYDFKNTEWKVNGVRCCRHMWELAMGGSPRRHRTIRSLVMRGISPSASESAAEAEKIGRLMTKLHDASGRIVNKKRSYAANWWKTLYLMSEYMPNEERIQIKGPSFFMYHRDFYGPVAKK